jgi:hypothetical protein
MQPGEQPAPSPDADGMELVVNPGVEVTVVCRVRRKAEPLRIVELELPEHLELVRWLVGNAAGAAPGGGIAPVDAGSELSLDALDRAMRGGLLVDEEQLPGPVPAPFACEIEPGAAALVPASELSRAEALAREPRWLRVNPALALQTGDEPPAGAATPPLDARLWRHLQHFLPRPHRGLDPRRPVLWVGSPRTGVHLPYWPPPAVVDSLLAPGRHTGECAPADAYATDERTALVLAEVLLPREPPASDPATGRVVRADGIRHIALGRLVPPLFLAAIRRYYRALRLAGYFTTDTVQVVGKREGIYGDPVAMFLQSALAAFAGRAVQRTLLPSYTWSYRYLPGATLERHRDRPQCRWNISLCVDTDAPDDRVSWPLHLQEDRGPCALPTELGEAVLYSGTDTWHWREPLDSPHAVTFSLFHYVEPGFEGKRR